MYIPPQSTSPVPNDASIAAFFDIIATTAFDGSGSHKSPTEKWSSFIGIVTAICGNILISFALNTQRYAHIRMSRDRDERDERRRRVRRLESGRGKGYGTQQEVVAQVRERENLKGEGRDAGYEVEGDEDVDETAPLIPSVASLDSVGKDDGEDEDTASGEDEEAEEAKEKSYLRSPIWWLGISMMTAGEAGNFLAYGFAPASIVSPLGVVALISNCLIAPLLLHERFRWRDGIGVIVAVAGCVTVVLSASDSNPKLTPDSIWHLITRWEFETYLGITVALIIALCAASNKYGDRTILIDIGLVGLFGGYTALSTKGVASLLSNTIWRVVTFTITYLLVVVLVFTAVMQIKYINRALQRFNATMVIPTQFVMFTLSVIIGSAILYRDFERTTTQQAIKFVGGCALTFTGVYFITSGRQGEGEPDDEETGEGEDGISLVDEERMRHEVRERPDGPGKRQSFMASSSKSAPAARRLFTSDDIPPSETPPQIASPTSRAKPTDLTPANTAAIHDHSASNLPELDPRQPPPMHATTSAPEVPTITTANTTYVPTPPSRPKTPARGVSGPAVDSPSKAPPSTPQPRRPPPDQNLHHDPSANHKLLNRHSIAGLVPGPLTSPLSSSLSAIVADSLRRGVDHSPNTGGSIVRRRSLRRGISRRDPNAAALKRHSIASGEMDFPDHQHEDGQGTTQEERPVQGRIRSLSAAVGDIFGTSAGSKGQGSGGGGGGTHDESQ
jgi:drug/metabolite transporter (DMT)-like permease